MSVAAAVITALGTLAVTGVSGYLQSEELDKGEAASKSQYLGELAQRNKELAASEKMRRAELAESKRQAKVAEGLKKEELAMTQNEYAHSAFRDRVKNLTGILDKNEQLKTLYIDRFKGLRN